SRHEVVELRRTHSRLFVRKDFKLLFDPRRNYEKALTVSGATGFCVRNFLFCSAAAGGIAFAIPETETAHDESAKTRSHFKCGCQPTASTSAIKGWAPRKR